MLDTTLQNLFVVEMIKGMVQVAHGINYRPHTRLIYPIHTKPDNEPEQ